MQTNFSLSQLQDPATAECERILRTCVHCGFCTATCPTYVLLGDELDSPRGRIYLIKDMLENERPATPEVVKHIDRCLSCLACMTTCPSGVHYMHLVDHARSHIAATYRRPLRERLLRAGLAWLLPYPGRFRAALAFASTFKWLTGLLEAARWPSLAAMLRLAPQRLEPRATAKPQRFLPSAPRRGRVALLDGCVNIAMAPQITAAAISVLNRHGVEVVLPEGQQCCGAISQHLGRADEALHFVRRNIEAWSRLIEAEGLDAILITASGCGTMVKDYGFLLRGDAHYAKRAARVARLSKDVTEYLMSLELRPVRQTNLTVAYHSACSLQHGQNINREPKDLLTRAGFSVRDIPEAHLCCGSAGTYNILEPELAARLLERKAANIAKIAPDLVAAGNLGCMTQLATAVDIPIGHTVELLDWATGGEPSDAVRRALRLKERTGSLAPVM